ncbi:MAG: MmgE/PrpD family protein [Deltaproteobacteria bacterium]|nr:MmgE/PrpD family protein [Deltaproteobacteria bacterium]
MTVPLTLRLSEFVANSIKVEISAKAARNAKLFFLDTIGAAMASLSYPVGKIALEYCEEVGGVPKAAVWGSSLKTSLPMAAFTNALLAHGIDFDDWEAILHSGHPSCMIVAPALAVGEALDASGKDVIKAYVTGVEIYNRIASGAPNIRKRGFHGTPVFGSMGAVAAAASLLRIDVKQIEMAFGIAASGVSGIQRQHGSMCKPYHAGNAARNGVEAALLARFGFTSSEAIFESPMGFCDTLFGKGNCNYQKMIEGLGDPYYIESPGLSFKPYPFSTPQYLAADAILHLVNHSSIKYEDVNKVELRVSQGRYDHHFIPEPKSGLQAKFSINYVTAIGILEGKFEKESFADEKVRDPKVREALSKVEVIIDPNVSQAYTEETCPMTVILKNGKRLAHTTKVPRGHPENPVTEEEVLQKFRGNVSHVLPDEKREKLIAVVTKLDELATVRTLTELLVRSSN